MCEIFVFFRKASLGGILHDWNGTYGHRNTGEPLWFLHRRFLLISYYFDHYIAILEHVKWTIVMVMVRDIIFEKQ